MKPKPPKGPPPLKKMGERKVSLEGDRKKVFPVWKKMLEAHDGNVTYAGKSAFPEEKVQVARDRANYITRKMGLLEYAASLREKATGNRGPGRPKVVS